jgi:hypothetical protein
VLKIFRLQSLRAIFAIVLAIALFALPTPISSPQKASAAPTFGDDNGDVPHDGMMIFHFQANGAYTPLGLLPETSSFTVMADNQVIQVASLTLVGGYLLNINLVSAIWSGAVVTVSYTAPNPPSALTTNKALQDTSGNDASSFGPLTVENTSLVSALPTPAAPTIVAGPENVTATVTAPASGGQPKSYKVYASPGGETCRITGASGSCIIANLTAGTTYTFFVKAYDNFNGSTPLSPASASVTALAKGTTPNTPGTPSVVAGEESATITVTAPTGGTAPTSYEVTATPGGAKCTVDGASGSCTITGLTAGTAYTFTTIAKTASGSSSASTASTSITVLPKTTATIPAGYAPSWDKEPLTDSETDANTVGFFPSTSPGVIIITDEMGFTLDKKNGIKPKIRMKNYAGKIKMSISASYKVGAKTVKYKCAFAPFGTAKKIKTAKWRWYTPKKACILPAPLVAAVRANTATLSASGKWTRQWLTTSKKARPDKTKIKPRTLKYTMKAKPAAVK